jgi:hypothetical protein
MKLNIRKLLADLPGIVNKGIKIAAVVLPTYGVVKGIVKAPKKP